jgi:hypothetical protein
MVTLDVSAFAPGNGEADNFDFSYQVNNGAWLPLGTLLEGTGTQSFSAMLPAGTSGTVRLRVVDTDRSTGAGNTDTVSVSLIRVTSLGDPEEQMPTVSIVEPTGDMTVTGGTEVTFGGEADDYEDGPMDAYIVWSSDKDGYLGSGAGASAVLTGGTPPKEHLITASVTDSAGNTATDSITVTVDDTPTPTSLAVADLDGSSSSAGKGGKWSATVSVRVEDNLGNPVSGATVSGNWSGGASGSGNCTTDGSGVCDISKGGLKGNVSSVTFSVTDIAGPLTYSGANSDLDGDSDGTTITVGAP